MPMHMGYKSVARFFVTTRGIPDAFNSHKRIMSRFDSGFFHSLEAWCRLLRT